MSRDNKTLYEQAFQVWGFDKQVLKLGEEAGELSVAACQFLGYKINGKHLAEEAADVEIMIEQLRHNGMSSVIDVEKERKLARLALLLEGCGDIDAVSDIAKPLEKLAETEHSFQDEFEEMSISLLDHDFFRASQYARRAAGRLMYLAQLADRIGRHRAAPAPARTEAE